MKSASSFSCASVRCVFKHFLNILKELAFLISSGSFAQNFEPDIWTDFSENFVRQVSLVGTLAVLLRIEGHMSVGWHRGRVQSNDQHNGKVIGCGAFCIEICQVQTNTFDQG